ncbi:MAG: IS630 family transposase [Planctomycetes bacterium]|nr:IS630 family transposase [Planctomycetota bacterium]
MKDYTLSKGKIAELEKFHRSLRDKHQADRVKAVIALSKGWSAAQVAEILLFDEKTSRHYFERYQQGGLQALVDNNYSGAEPKLDKHQMSKLESYLEEHILPDAKSVIAHINKQYGVRYSVSGVTDLLHRLGFSYKKPTHVPGKQDPARQRAFLKEYEHIKASKGQNDPICFADATHPQHNSIPSYGWIKKGQEKALKANCGRQRLNINGAINIETLEPTTGFYDTINADSTIDLFSKIKAKHPNAKTIYIIVDNARYYRSRLLKQYVKRTNIKLIFLPPYSPNLNLIERYWKIFKKKVLNNRYYETFGEFKLACQSFFRKRKKYLPELQMLLTENFHIQAA